MKRTVLTGFLAAMLAIALAASASAQEPAPTELNAAATQDAPTDDDGFVAKAKRFADETQIVERLNGDVDGWYPRLGGMTTGSGFAFGPGYRTHLTDNRIYLDVSAGFSMKGYKAADLQVEWLQERFDRVELWTNYRYQDFPQEDFFGFNAPTSAMRTNYALKSHGVSALGIFHVRPWLRTGTEFGYFMPTIGSGTDEKYPSTGLLFSDIDAPGLAAQPDFLHTTLFAEVDYRDERENARSGGFYRVSFGVWDDTTLEQFDFKRFDAEAAQFVPIFTKKHVIASRVGLAYVNNTGGERVPFYFVPYVGGGRTVRGYEEFRFQDENALWWNTEYRWNAIKYLDLALFYDVGKVARDWNDINLSDTRTAWGFGFRAASTKRVFARLDFGFGGDDRQIFFKLSPSF
jgi:outer membrane protein assembly factor BamA